MNVAKDYNILHCDVESIQGGRVANLLELSISKTKVVTEYIHNQHIHVSIYDVFYSQNSHQHVSAGISAILRVCAYTIIEKYKYG